MQQSLSVHLEQLHNVLLFMVEDTILKEILLVFQTPIQLAEEVEDLNSKHELIM